MLPHAPQLTFWVTRGAPTQGRHPRAAVQYWRPGTAENDALSSAQATASVTTVRRIQRGQALLVVARVFARQ